MRCDVAPLWNAPACSCALALICKKHLQGDETYMRTEYGDWMEEMQPVLRNLPAYGVYLRCPEPAVCEPSHLQKGPDHVSLLYCPGGGLVCEQC